MNSQRRIEPEDLVLYAMQLLSPDEAANVALYLENNPGAHQELAQIQGDLAAYAYSAEMQTPPALARTRLLKHVNREKRTGPLLRPIPVPLQLGTPQARPAAQPAIADHPHSHSEDGVAASIGAYQRGATGFSASTPAAGPALFSYETEAARPSLVTRALPWAGWAVAAGLAVSTVQFYRDREELKGTIVTDKAQLDQSASDAASAHDVLNAMNDQAAMRVTLRKPFAPVTPTGRTTYSPEKGVLIFVANNLDPVDTYKVYELWLIPTEGNPIPVGTFHPDANGYASFIQTNLPKNVEAKAFGITVENQGGAKTPTPPILMTGA